MTGEELSVLRNMPSSFITPRPSSHSEDSSLSIANSASSLAQNQQPMRPQSPPTSPSYHELRTVSNAYERTNPPPYNYQQTASVVPWTTCTSTPDLRRTVDMALSGTDLSMYGSSDRFSSFLNISSESLGSFKLGSNGELLLDRDSLKGSSIIGSQGTLDSGYGSMFLSGLVNDEQQLGSLKELSHTEVADTLLSLKHSRVMMNQYGPSAATAPANPGVDQPYQTSDLTSSIRSVPISVGTPDPHGTVRNHRYHGFDYERELEQDGSLSNIQFPSASSLDSASYLGNYWSLRDPHGSISNTPSRHPISSSGDLIAKTFSSSSLGLPDGYETSRLPGTAYWAITQSTPDVFESSQEHYIDAANTSDYHANSPGGSAQLYTTAAAARVSTIKSTDQLPAYPTAPAMLRKSRSSVPSVVTIRDDMRPCLTTSTSSSSSSVSSSVSSKIQENTSPRHRCHFCDKEFSRPGALKTHTKIHFGQKQYMCHVCSKAFFQAANLKAHLRVHSGEKPFSCNTCGKGFSQSSSVKTHMRTHSGERPYKCNECNRSFSDNSTLTKHQRIHSGQKPYQCTYCRQSFSQSGNLSRHMKIHTKSKD